MIDVILRQFRLSSTIIHHSLVCNRWQTDTSGIGAMSFHLVFKGQCYLHLPDGSRHVLQQGDFVLLPSDSPHILSDIPEISEVNRTEIQFLAYPLTANIEHSTGLVCGYFDLHEDMHHPLIQALPNVIVYRNGNNDTVLPASLNLLMLEAQESKGMSVLERCAELFFLMLLRHLCTQDPNQLSLLHGLQHPRLGPVLKAILDEPGKSWTVESLAEIACLSRSAFSEKFREMLGEPPLSYLTRLRLQQARYLLQQGDAVTAVAAKCGYHAEEAFAKAFKRQFGYGPGKARRMTT